MNNTAPPSHNTSKKSVPDSKPLHMLAYGQDCLAELASHIIHSHKDKLPNLTGVTVLLFSPQAATQLRKLLLSNAQAYGFSALLGPEIDSLPNWISRLSYSELPVLTEHQRELMLVEALVKHPYLYGKGNPWTLADSLLKLFDELNERHIRLPEKFEDFLQQLGSAYELNNKLTIAGSSIEAGNLTGEAHLVHTLWQAWRLQMQEEGITDRHSNYLFKLINSPQQTDPDQTFYLAGFSQLSPAETDWLKSFINRGKTSLWLQGSAPPDDATDYHPDCITRELLKSLKQTVTFPAPVDQYGHCLNNIFSTTATGLKDRAQNFSKEIPLSPVTSRLSLFEAKSAEQEALAIDLQTRLWWLEGKRNIGIITENRRLARRVRALLERAEIELQDAAGWALSTTSAAAILERWMEAVEEDFAYQPLLDLLKSPFFLPGKVIPNHFSNHEREDLLATVYRFEQSVILKENIGSGLERYRQHTQYRQSRLTAELADEYNEIYPLLDILADAARPLLPFINNNNLDNTNETRNPHSPNNIFDALNESLTILGLTTSFSKDDAGRDILEELKQMQAATSNSSLRMSWPEFRAWLGRTLERFNFQPNTQSNHVQLMGLAQSPLHQFDALIIAAAEREHLPGKLNQSPFFNDGVRQALGLASQEELLSQRFYHFRRLLESSPNIVITRCTEQNGEDIACSPWLERIQSFHTIAYNDNLINKTLTNLVAKKETIVTNTLAPLPQVTSANPAVQIESNLIPKTISASGYQQLMNCPYQFFAARCLGLEPPETIREMLEKSDYGERVHLCLHAFHSGVANLPGPYEKPLNTDTRDEAIRCLTSIADAVFSSDLEDNFLHRGWLKRWHDLIPLYIEWQTKRQYSWQVQNTETNVEAKLAGADITLRGRLDRIDISTKNTELDLGNSKTSSLKTGISEIGIIDYKTGNVAGEEDVLDGESIQLPFYALLAEQAMQQPISRVEYVSLDQNKVQTKTPLENDRLHELTRQVGLRLAKLITNIQDGEPMIAWGDEKTCSWCQMSGICRRESWSES